MPASTRSAAVQYLIANYNLSHIVSHFSFGEGGESEAQKEKRIRQLHTRLQNALAADTAMPSALSNTLHHVKDSAKSLFGMKKQPTSSSDINFARPLDQAFIRQSFFFQSPSYITIPLFFISETWIFQLFCKGSSHHNQTTKFSIVQYIPVLSYRILRRFCLRSNKTSKYEPTSFHTFLSLSL